MNKQLPNNWKWTELGEIADWGSGGTPKSTNSAFYNGQYPWLVIGDLNDDLVLSSKKTITEEGLKNSSAKLVEKGALLIAMYGSIGKLGIAGLELTTNQAIAFTKKLHGDIPTKYLFYYLLSQRANLLAKGKGGAQQNISQTVLKKVEFPLAPLNEQKRIVKKLDAIFEKINQNKARLERIPQLLKDFRQQVLQAAVTGELTKEWREENELEEKTKELLTKIINQRRLEFQNQKARDRKTRKPYLKEDFLNSMDEISIPKEWIWVSGESLFDKIFDGTHFSPKNHPTGTYKYITAKNIKEWGIDLTNISYVSEEDHESIFSRADVRYLDLLYIKDGATAGIATLNTLKEEFSLLSSVGVFRPNLNYINPLFYKYFLNGFKENMLSNVSGVAITRLTLKKLKAIYFPLPSKCEQDEIVSKVEELFAFADKIEDNYQKAKTKIEQLPQTILAKAFTGELVEQDPKDEPASELLAKIKEAKKTLKKKKK